MAKRPVGPDDDYVKEPSNLWTRRNFFGYAAWGGVAGFFGIASLAAVRSFFPRALFEPPTSFKAGFPEEYTVGSVSEKYKAEFRVWIVRNDEGIYALSAICTHLGCTPRWLTQEDKFKCPCHGSGFRRTGINYEGPAPRPLERCKIGLSDDGQLLIDTAVRFKWEAGQWDDPDAFLLV